MEGEPADSLCRLAEATQTDLIVMSTHGAKGWVRKWLGGTTEKVLRKASSSVLVVPHRQPAPAELEQRSYRITPESAASWDTPWTEWDYHGRT